MVVSGRWLGHITTWRNDLWLVGFTPGGIEADGGRPWASGSTSLLAKWSTLDLKRLDRKKKHYFPGDEAVWGWWYGVRKVVDQSSPYMIIVRNVHLTRLVTILV